MFGAGRRGGRLETQPLDSASGPHRSGRSGRFDRHIKLVAARGLVGLARSLLRTVGRAYRAGYLDLARVECCLRVSAKLRSLGIETYLDPSMTCGHIGMKKYVGNFADWLSRMQVEAADRAASNAA